MNTDHNKVNPAEVQAFLATLHPNSVFEIRIPKAGRSRTVRGYFDDPAAAAQAVQAWSGKVPAIYVTLNPVKPDLLARCANRLEPYAENTTADPDIEHRQWLLVDIDPVRPSGISATDAELAAAKAMGRNVYADLSKADWPAPLVVESGNGVHLLYRIDLPNDEASTALIKNTLAAMAGMYDTALCKIDQGVFNASRITKLVGTLAAKGDHTATRPHRLAQRLTTPAELVPVPIEQLTALADFAPTPPPPPSARWWVQQDKPDDFAAVNSAALERLSAWVPELFPGAKAYRQGYRVTSKQLGRDLEEDLSLQPDGIQDFGEERGMTPIDVFLAWGGCATPKDALYWLADRVGVVVQRSRNPAPSAGRRTSSHKPNRDRDPASTPPPANAGDEDWQEQLQKTKSGKIVNHIGNVMLILQHALGGSNPVSYCELSYRTMIVGELPWEGGGRLGEWTDRDTTRACIWMAQNYGIAPATKTMNEALDVLGEQNARHPVREYLRSLEWDGVNRLDHWLTDALGVVRSEYTAKVSRLWMIAAVARVMQPGCKADCVLILEGKQGEGKSTALAILAGEWFTDTHFTLGDKDGYQQMQGMWICEMAELDSFNRAESQRSKSFFSSSTDRYRASYGHRAQSNPRQCVFAGTTNQDVYLKDVTGNRRYWPVTCTHNLDAEWLTAQRDQLWAEATARYDAGEPWWPQRDEMHLFEDEQEQRMQTDAWEELIINYLDDSLQRQTNHFTSTTLLTALGLETHQMKLPEMTRIGHIMNRLKWPKKRITQNGRRQWVYERPLKDQVPKAS